MGPIVLYWQKNDFIMALYTTRGINNRRVLSKFRRFGMQQFSVP
jgi:hypothetical protein